MTTRKTYLFVCIFKKRAVKGYPGILYGRYSVKKRNINKTDTGQKPV